VKKTYAEVPASLRRKNPKPNLETALTHNFAFKKLFSGTTAGNNKCRDI
jgi:hypothetical protein